MGRFLGKPEMESFPNAAKKGIKIFSDQQIQAVSGYERLYRLFWNRKAEELCHSPSFVKWSKSAITGVIATEWSLKKTALLCNHATRLMDKKSEGNSKRKQKVDTVYQGSLSMLNEHKSLLNLDKELRSLKRADNTARDKKKKIQALEVAMQGKMTELKKRQEALRKGLENMAKEKQTNNIAIVGQMDVNTTQLDNSSIQDLIKIIMPQDDAGEGFSGAEGPDEKAESNSEHEDMPPNDGDNGLSDPSEEHDSGAEGPDEKAESDSEQEGNSPYDGDNGLSDPSEEHDSGDEGPDEKAESDSEQEGMSPYDGDNGLSDLSEEHDSGDDDQSEESSDEDEHSPSRKRAKME